jgi:biopolymer transport protein ExbD
MAFALKQGFDEPLHDLNTTPLIDVMLVLLVMFIITIPVATHEIAFDLPAPGPIAPLPEIWPENTISISPDSTITWNGTTVSEAGLLTLLRASTSMAREPLLRFDPQAAAPFGATLRVLNLIRASNPASFAFVGNDRYAQFGKADLTSR